LIKIKLSSRTTIFLIRIKNINEFILFKGVSYVTGSVVAGGVVSGKPENIPYLNIIYPCVTLV